MSNEEEPSAVSCQPTVVTLQLPVLSRQIRGAHSGGKLPVVGLRRCRWVMCVGRGDCAVLRLALQAHAGHPAVILRRNSQWDRSDRGAATQAVPFFYSSPSATQEFEGFLSCHAGNLIADLFYLHALDSPWQRGRDRVSLKIWECTDSSGRVTMCCVNPSGGCPWSSALMVGALQSELTADRRGPRRATGPSTSPAGRLEPSCRRF